MMTIGITGAIGSGKSTAAAMLGAIIAAPIYNADAHVHALFAHDRQMQKQLHHLFGQDVPEAFLGKNKGIDRAALGSFVFADPARLARLEGVVHPRLDMIRRDFIRRAFRNGCAFCLLDVPLLFETGLDRQCDRVIVTCAPAFIRWQRVHRRPGINRTKFTTAGLRQIPSFQARRLADWTVPTGLGRRDSYRRLVTIAGHIKTAFRPGFSRGGFSRGIFPRGVSGRFDGGWNRKDNG